MKFLVSLFFMTMFACGTVHANLSTEEKTNPLVLKTFFTPAEAKAGTAYEILVINYYADSNPWSNIFLRSIVSLASKNVDLGLQTISLNVPCLQGNMQVDQFKDFFAQKLPQRRPNMVVLIGSGCFSLCWDLNKRWKDIPMLLIADKEYAVSDSLIFLDRPLSMNQRVPLKTYLKGLNITLMEASTYTKETIDMMKLLLPDMKEVYCIGDRTYSSRQAFLDFENVMEESFPQLKYRFLSAGEVTTDSLFYILDQVETRTTGVLYFSWNSPREFGSGYATANNYYRIIGSVSIPLFTVRPIGIKEEGAIVGGYIFDEETFIEQMEKTINEIVGGMPPRMIPFYKDQKGRPEFNYASLARAELDPDKLPSNTVLHDVPPSFFEQYKYVAIGLAILIVIIVIFGLTLYIRQITRIRLLERRQFEVINRYRKLVENMPILYARQEVLYDDNHNIKTIRTIEVNEAFEHEICPSSEIVGYPFGTLMGDFATAYRKIVATTLRNSEPASFQHYYERNGNYYMVIINPDDSGKYLDVFCVNRSELHDKEAQLDAINKKLSLVLEVSSVIPVNWDIENQYIVTEMPDNNHFKGALPGLTNDKQYAVTIANHYERVWEEDREKARTALRQVCSGEIQKIKVEYRLNLNGDGVTYEWIESMAVVNKRNEKGEVTALIGSMKIITERKQAEEELVKAKNKAQESDRLKSAFLANMSHEIRTPLNAIIGFSDLLSKTDDKAEKDEFVGIINTNNALLLQLINDILDLSKIEAGTMEFVYTDFEMNELMESLNQSLQLKVPADKDIKLILELPKSQCEIHSERNRLSQVVINLVTNALKFTESGTVNFGYIREGDMLHFHVTDSGCGIPADQLDNVFQRFVKLNAFVSGTGLGLSICKTCIEHMGGEIGVNSVVGKGSTFWFTLPFVPQKGVTTKVTPQE